MSDQPDMSLRDMSCVFSLLKKSGILEYYGDVLGSEVVVEKKW